MKRLETRFRLNGREIVREVSSGATLLEFLREEFHLTGSKEGCGAGECGACTVLVDGEPVAACLMMATKAHGKEIVTVEGLMGADGTLHPVQEAFVAEGGVQCGFCTPGFITAVAALLERNDDPTDEEILEGLQGNLCRCTGYQKILAAVHRAALEMRGRRTG